MKTMIILILIMAGLFSLFQAYLMRSSGTTKSQPYKVLESDNQYEIRYYPEAVMASTFSTATSYEEISKAGFRKLASYIFGGNDQRQKIAMTAPVYMDITDTGSSMSFVMPADFTLANLPVPKDMSIQLSTSKADYVAVLSFGGFASDKKIAAKTAQLKSLFLQNSISYDGNFRYLGYNPPYQLLGRKNEIMVSIEWENKL